jgi:proline iminopeptidase
MNNPQAETTSQKVITSDGVALHVEVGGRGTPCLYVHGGPGSGSYWARKFAGDIFERHFQMIYLDQRGCCRSTSPRDGNYTLERMVADFEAVRQALGIEHWLTMGHSFAGLLQMGYIQRFPQVIQGMLLINAALNLNETFRLGYCRRACELLGISNPTPYTDETIPILERWGALIGLLKERGLMWQMGYDHQENDEQMNATFGEVPNFNWDYEVMLTVSDYWQDFKPATADVPVPVLFFYGQRDWMTGPEHYRGLKFPSLLLWGSDVAHMPFMENKPDLERAIAAYRQKTGF